MQQLKALALFVSAAAVLSASAISTASVSIHPQGGPACDQSSGGAPVICSFMMPPANAGGSASAFASFGSLSESVNIGANIPFNGTGMAAANASYDQLLLLPGNGQRIINGVYDVSLNYGGDYFFTSLGSIMQAGTKFVLHGPLISEPLPFTVTLGVPFDVSASINLFESLPGSGFATASLTLEGFTDLNGNKISPQVVSAVPEPRFGPLLACILPLSWFLLRRIERN